MKLPAPFEPIRAGGARAFARAEAAAWVREVLASGATLHAAAGRRPDAVPMRGRGTVHRIEVDGATWAVRHYRRGGLVAPVLDDRYLRVGTPRPVAEARASEAARARGIPTPGVVAGAVYPAGPFYRADLVTEFVPGTVELAELLFGEAGGSGARAEPALRAAGRLVARMARAGVLHPDVNAMNVLISGDGPAEAVLLDLDRCRVGSEAAGVPAAPMADRLRRSLRKLGRRSGRPLGGEAWAALDAGLSEGSAP